MLQLNLNICRLVCHESFYDDASCHIHKQTTTYRSLEVSEMDAHRTFYRCTAKSNLSRPVLYCQLFATIIYVDSDFTHI